MQSSCSYIENCTARYSSEFENRVGMYLDTALRWQARRWWPPHPTHQEHENAKRLIEVLHNRDGEAYRGVAARREEAGVGGEREDVEGCRQIPYAFQPQKVHLWWLVGRQEPGHAGEVVLLGGRKPGDVVSLRT